MKLPLKTIVSRPVIQNGVLTGYEFLNALRKLGEDPLPVKARFALGRVLHDAEGWAEAYEVKRSQLVRDRASTAAPGERATLTPKDAADIHVALLLEQAQEVELPLDLPIHLPETSKLTATEMMVLGPLVEA